MASFAGSLVSDPTSFVILELTGPQNNLVLEGRALPYRPLTFEGGMRAEFTWYPGNPTATIQMLGADEKSTVISGMWKDKHISTAGIGGIGLFGGEGIAKFNGSRVADVRSLVRVVEGFRLRGQLLEVGWDEHTRQGILIRFRHSWLRREDLEWEMEFAWASRGEPITPVAFGPDFNLQDVFNEISNAVTALKEIAQAPFALISDIKNAIAQALEIIDEATAALKDTANAAAQAVQSGQEGAKTALASLQTIKSQAQTIRDTMESLPARAMRSAAEIQSTATVVGEAVTTVQETVSTITGSGGSTSVQTAAVTASEAAASEVEDQGIEGITQEEALEAEKFKRDLRAAARDLRAVAALRGDDLLGKTVRVPNVQAIIARDGEDLRDVSARFYGTTEEWKRLLTYNNLASGKLEVGQIVLVPPLSTQDQQ